MRILIADDEEALRDILETLLTRQGHEVVAARDGEAAFREFMNTNGNEFDYVITDYQMPRKNGVVLIMDIRAVKPEQKCIMVSGDPPKLDSMTRELTGEFPMLRKPYRNAELIALLT